MITTAPLAVRVAGGVRLALMLAGILVLVAGCARPGGQLLTGQAQYQQAVKQALAYSRCMRSHGVPDYPDPKTSGGNISLGPGPNIDTNSPQYQSAQKACRKLMPGPGNLSPQEQAQAREDGLKMARCMRAHGFPNFPDPNGQGVITITPSDGIDTSSPQYRSAASTCQSGTVIIAQVHGSRRAKS
ncbi:MAG TPA: hypothetical protein VIA06_23140 [Candidatus Dormibacteraeota bacterium]|jgi:hypothetical protein|nr:hypothetical protein [Candidatus Dormibacteraeota bacterium]